MLRCPGKVSTGTTKKVALPLLYKQISRKRFVNASLSFRMFGLSFTEKCESLFHIFFKFTK